MSSVVPYYIQDTGRGPIIMPSPSHETDADANVTRGGDQYDDDEDDDRNNERRGGGGRRRARAAE